MLPRKISRTTENPYRDPHLFPQNFPSHLGDRQPPLSTGDILSSSPATHVRGKPAFPVADYHVHLSPDAVDRTGVQLGKERQVQIGIVDHPGPGYKIHTDADLKQYIDGLRNYPVRIGLQPVYAGWSKAFSKSLLDQLDYVLMDALTLPRPDGGWLAIWQIDTMVDDEEEFMTRYMQFIEQVLTTEPIDIFAWPTFLPVPIARQYSHSGRAADRPHHRSREGQKDRNRNQRSGTRPRREFHCHGKTRRPEIHLRHRLAQPPKRRALLLLFPDGPKMRPDRGRHVCAQEEVVVSRGAGAPPASVHQEYCRNPLCFFPRRCAAGFNCRSLLN